MAIMFNSTVVFCIKPIWVLLTYLSVYTVTYISEMLLHNSPSIVCKNLKVKCVTSGTGSHRKPSSVLLQIGFSSSDDVTPSGQTSSSHSVPQYLHTRTAPVCAAALFLPDFIHREKFIWLNTAFKNSQRKCAHFSNTKSLWQMSLL